MLAVWIKSRAGNEFTWFDEANDQLLAIVAFKVYLGEATVERNHVCVCGILLKNDFSRFIFNFMPVLVNQVKFFLRQVFERLSIERTSSTIFKVSLFEHRRNVVYLTQEQSNCPLV